MSIYSKKHFRPQEDVPCMVLIAAWLAFTSSHETYPNALALSGAVQVGKRIIEAVGGWSSRDC